METAPSSPALTSPASSQASQAPKASLSEAGTQVSEARENMRTIRRNLKLKARRQRNQEKRISERQAARFPQGAGSSRATTVINFMGNLEVSFFLNRNRLLLNRNRLLLNIFPMKKKGHPAADPTKPGQNRPN